MKKKRYSIIMLMSLIVVLFTGCDVNDLRRTEYVEISDSSYEKVSNKDAAFDKAIEAGEIEIEETIISTENNLFNIEGTTNNFYFELPYNWYETTEDTNTKLTAKGSFDTELSTSWNWKSFVNEDASHKMYIYTVSLENFKNNLLNGATPSVETDKNIRKYMGKYPNVSDVVFETIGNVNYAYKMYNGQVTNDAGLTYNRCYIRSCYIKNDEMLLVCFYANDKTIPYNALTTINNFYDSIDKNNIN